MTKQPPALRDIIAQFRALSEQLRGTTNAADRQELLKQFRIALDQADKLNAGPPSDSTY